jgi:hypothetical protein
VLNDQADKDGVAIVVPVETLARDRHVQVEPMEWADPVLA